MVRYRVLPKGDRQRKFEELARISLDDDGWTDCPDEWLAPFLPSVTGAWSMFPTLDDYFVYSG